MLVIIYAAIALMIVLPFVIWHMDASMKRKTISLRRLLRHP